MKKLILIIVLLFPFKNTKSYPSQVISLEEKVNIEKIRLEVLKSKIRVELATLKYKVE